MIRVVDGRARRDAEPLGHDRRRLVGVDREPARAVREAPVVEARVEGERVPAPWVAAEVGLVAARQRDARDAVGRARVGAAGARDDVLEQPPVRQPHGVALVVVDVAAQRRDVVGRRVADDRVDGAAALDRAGLDRAVHDQRLAGQQDLRARVLRRDAP
jgi:hypothetical protein